MNGPDHCIVLLTAFLFISFSDETTVKEENCRPFRCRNTNYSYPFWLSNGTNSNDYTYCGYPSFGLTCSEEEDGRPSAIQLRLPSDNYFVESIDKDSKTFTAIDADVAGSVDCPRVTKNVSLDEYSQLSFVSSVDTFLHFFFNCSTPPGSDQQFMRKSLPCFHNKTSTFVFISGMHPPGYGWFGGCLGNVLAPVVLLPPEQRL